MKSEILVVIATFLTTIAQLSFKLGSNAPGVYLGAFPINVSIVSGFFVYGISALLFTYALRNGELSVLYPIWSLSFVWIFLVSMFMLNESIIIFNWLGIVLIILGVSLVYGGAKNA